MATEIAETPPKQTAAAGNGNGTDQAPLIYEDPNAIVRSPFNRQIDTKSEKFQELLASVKRRGVIEPLICRRVEGVTELIAGERRWRAAKELKLPSVPILLRKASDTEAIEIQAEENEKREDLSPIEQAHKYEQLVTQYEKEQKLGRDKAIERLSERIGKARSTIYEALRLVKLPPKVKEAVAKNELPASHAGLLLKLDGDPNAQERVLKAIRSAESWEGEQFNDKTILSFRNTKSVVEDEVRLGKAREKWRELATAHKKKGGKVIGEDGKAATYEFLQKNNYVRGDSYSNEYSLAGTQYGKLMGKEAPLPVLAHDENWLPLELYTTSEAKAAIEKNGHKKRSNTTSRSTSSSGSSSSARKPSQSEAATKEIARIREDRAAKTIEEIVSKAEKISGDSAAFYVWLLEAFNDHIGLGHNLALAKRLGLSKASWNGEAEIKKCKAKTAKSLRGVLVQALLPEPKDAAWGNTRDGWDSLFISSAKAFGVKVPAHKVELPKPEKKKVQTPGTPKQNQQTGKGKRR